MTEFEKKREDGGQMAAILAEAAEKLTDKKTLALVEQRIAGLVEAGFVIGAEENLPTSGRRAHYYDHKGRLVVHNQGDSTVVFKPFSPQANNPTTKKYASTKMNVRPAVGIGIPQMPLTRSSDRVQREMDKRLTERTLQYTQKMLDKVFR